MWDPNIGMGTVTHQNIGYLFPMGPYYWLFDRLGVPDWVAQRLWLGSLLFAAGVGVLYLLRTFGLRGPGVVVAALAYMLTPYTLDYAARISVLLMPWAALPWMIGLMRKALRDGGWRYPALFALVVQVVGGVNATALVFAGLGPSLWIVYSWLVAREVQWRRALGVTVRTGVLTIVTSLWWIAGLAIQGGYGLDVLKYTETVEAVARTSTPNEILRGLGYWFFYGQDRLGPWIEAAENYTQRPVVIIAGYVLVALALLAAGVRALAAPGVLRRRCCSSASSSRSARIRTASPTPLGARVQGVRHRLDRRARAAQHGARGAARRARDRGAARRRHERGVAALRRNARPVLAVGSVGDRRRAAARELPGAVRRHVLRQEPAAARGHPAVLERRGAATSTRAATRRGCSSCRAADFASYRWGNTVDPITPGLMDRPVRRPRADPVGRPGHGRSAERARPPHPGRARSIRTGSPRCARRMGVGDVVLRNDIQYERYDLVSAARARRACSRQCPGSAPRRDSGRRPRRTLAAAARGRVHARVAPANEAPPAPVVVYPGRRTRRRSCAPESTQQALMIAGDGEGLVDAADVGLLDGAGIVQYSGTYDTPEKLRAALERRHRCSWSPTRTAGRRAGGPRCATTSASPSSRARSRSATTSATRGSTCSRPSDDAARSTMDQRGVEWATATSYGNTITYTPEDARRARVRRRRRDRVAGAARSAPAIGQMIRVDLDDPITTDRVNLVQPINGGRDRYITKVQAPVRRQGHRSTPSSTARRARRPVRRSSFDSAARSRTLEIEVTGRNVGNRRLHGIANAVGLRRGARARRRHDRHAGAGVARWCACRPICSTRPGRLARSSARRRHEPGSRRADPAASAIRSRPSRASSRCRPARRSRSPAPRGSTSEAGARALAAVLGDGADGAAVVRSRRRARPCRVASAVAPSRRSTATSPPRGRRRSSTCADQYVDYDAPGADHVRPHGPRRRRRRPPLGADPHPARGRRRRARPHAARRSPTKPGENATATVPLSFAPVTGSHVRVTIVDVREASTFNYYAHGL